MKIAFSTSGDSLDAPLDSRFGRAPAFLIFDAATRTFEVLGNAQNLNAPQGAGIQAAETVVRSGAERLVTGHCGPKAFRVLTTAGVAIYNTELPTVREALDALEAGRLTAAGGADVDGHWV